MNNYLAMNICEAIMPIKDDSVNVTIVTNNGNVYNNVDYEDIYDNLDDYEYPYNYINRSDL